MAKDPRLNDPALTVNDALLDAAIRHRIRLEALGTGYTKAILKLLNASFVDVTDRLAERLVKIEAAGYDAGPGVTKRLESLLADLERLIDKAYGAAEKDLTGNLEQLAGYEAEFTRDTVKRELPVAWQFTMPSTATLEALVTADPIAGSLLSEWTADLSYATKGRLRGAIRAGVLEGQTTAEIVRTIRGTKSANYKDGLLEISRRNAETWVRTSVSMVSTRARERFFADNDDLVKGIKWVATLDGRTTPICRARDGKVYDVDAGPRPPAHPNCRSVTVPVIASADELGLDLPRGERASMNGQVPADLTYGEWLKRQPREFVDETLGPTRAALFLQGKLPIDRFVRDDGHQYTLAELRQREKTAFKRAGV